MYLWYYPRQWMSTSFSVSKGFCAIEEENLTVGESNPSQSHNDPGDDVVQKKEKAILDAASQGDTAKVKALLRDDPSLIAVRDERGNTLLHRAATGKYSLARLLVEQGADPNAAGDHGNTPLFDAVLYGRLRIAELLVSHGADVNAKAEYASTPLNSVTLGLCSGCSSQQQIDTFNYLLAHGADVETRDDFGRTLLHQAAISDWTPAVRFLIDHGIDINAADKYGSTAFQGAAYLGKDRVAKAMLACGADINAKDHEGRTALSNALGGYHLRLARFLYDLGGRMEDDDAMRMAVLLSDRASLKSMLTTDPGICVRKDDHARTALHWAAALGKKSIVKLILAGDADINAQDCRGLTPLHVVAKNGNADAARLLLEAGAKTELKDRVFGRTPLHFAVHKKHKSVAHLLIEHGADVNATDKHGDTPLYDAVLTSYELTETLLAHGADVRSSQTHESAQSFLDWIEGLPHRRMFDLVRKHARAREPGE